MWDRYGLRKTLARQPSLSRRAWRPWWGLGALAATLVALSGAAFWKANRPKSPRRSDATLARTLQAIPAPRPERLVVLGVNATFDVAEVREVALATAADLSRIADLDVRAVVGASYADLVDGVRLGDVDAAFLTPVAYVTSGLVGLTRPVLRILRNPGAQNKYYSALVARRGQFASRGIEVLCGRRIGYTELDSSSGFIYAKLTLLQHLAARGIPRCDLGREAFLGSHKAVLDAVARGDVDVGAVFASDASGAKGAWNQLGNYPLEAIAISEAIPSDGLFLRLSLGERKSTRLVQALFSYMGTPQGRVRLKKLFGADGLAEAKVGEYNGVVGALSRFEKLSQKYAKVGAAE